MDYVVVVAGIGACEASTVGWWCWWCKYAPFIVVLGRFIIIFVHQLFYFIDGVGTVAASRIIFHYYEGTVIETT